KFYGEREMVSLYVKYEDEGGENISFYGSRGPFDYLSDKAIKEAGKELNIKTINENNFELEWTGQSTSGTETTYQESWERASVPVGLSNIMNHTFGDQRTDRPYSGTWMMKGVRSMSTGELLPAKEVSYKLYGDGSFLAFSYRRAGDNETLFTGRAGTFEAVSDSVIKERGGQNTIKWLGENTFEASLGNGEDSIVEVWTRAEMPESYQAVCTMLNEIRSSGSGNADDGNKNYDEVVMLPDVIAQFPGGMNKATEFLSENIHYPKECVKDKVEGNVFVTFVITKDGEVVNPKVVKSPDSRLSAEAIRVVLSMPHWKPAQQKGQDVAMQMTLPVLFKLSNRK
ncbi:MAG: energy transducer TonB, partial [Paraprevotella sp.]|nr:energy transducer TonB [Paraprevotella sp.]